MSMLLSIVLAFSQILPPYEILKVDSLHERTFLSPVRRQEVGKELGGTQTRHQSPSSLEYSSEIRQWGCSRNETPFIFVHIGKAGGGSIRARFAASALNYSRNRWESYRSDPSYYYPVYDSQGSLHKGRFVDSDAANFLPISPFPFAAFQFEGVFRCHSTTPIGHMIACHNNGKGVHTKQMGVCKSHRAPKNNEERCDILYMGHNALGAELGFLPTPYLVNWWSNTTWAKQQDTPKSHTVDQISALLANRTNRLYGSLVDRKSRIKECFGAPLTINEWDFVYEECIRPKAVMADLLAKATMHELHGNFGPVYASMPVLRVTMLREPFSWLKSKFFWHSGWRIKNLLGPPDAAQPLKWDHKHPKKGPFWEDDDFAKCDDVEVLITTWGKQYALIYIFYLCGVHCMGEWQSIQDAYAHTPEVLKKKSLGYLKIMEEQASYNLRNSFAVVGLLHKSDEFYQMINKRVYYIDTNLNKHIQGSDHSTGEAREMGRCSEVYKNATFQDQILKKSPEIASMFRLYEIGVQVNQKQKEELQICN